MLYNIVPYLFSALWAVFNQTCKDFSISETNSGRILTKPLTIQILKEVPYLKGNEPKVIQLL
jgi:hypothetical protein